MLGGGGGGRPDAQLTPQPYLQFPVLPENSGPAHPRWGFLTLSQGVNQTEDRRISSFVNTQCRDPSEMPMTTPCLESWNYPLPKCHRLCGATLLSCHVTPAPRGGMGGPPPSVANVWAALGLDELLSPPHHLPLPPGWEEETCVITRQQCPWVMMASVRSPQSSGEATGLVTRTARNSV